METIEIKPGVYWVGAIDWDVRNFHGYLTQRGTTYNAYLVIDEKIVLIDTVKAHLADEMLARIRAIIEPAKIDYIVSNHVEMDHSGSISAVLELAPSAKVITSTMGAKGLKRHYKSDWDLQVVKSGDTLSIGKRTLAFVHVPMVHWPDSMVTYIPEDRLLLPNDGFGQHIASSERFDDELDWGILREEAAKYYANIIILYSANVQRAMGALGGLDIDMIAPSHGIIWRSRIPDILAEYQKWSTHATEACAVIVYDSMWGSTQRMAHALGDGLRETGVHVHHHNLKHTHISDVMTDVLTARLVCIGSPTLNNGILPTVGAFLTYVKGLRPEKRYGFAFGSYGWGGQAVKEIECVMDGLKWERPEDSIRIAYIPDEDELDAVRETGRALGKQLRD